MTRLLGVRTPVHDGLQILTLALAAAGGSSSSTSISPSTAFQNRITLWQETGDDLFQFDATETALADALTAAHDGAAVILPSKVIDLTASVTIPIGVTLLGLSEENTVLSFTGLNNESAVILSTRSVLEHLTVSVSGTQPLVGIDARAAKAKVRHAIVYMASHANNVKIWGGFAEST